DVIPGPHIDMRSHVEQVAPARTNGGPEGSHAVGAREAAFRMSGSLDGVDIEMIGANVIGPALQDRVQHAQDFQSVRARLAFRSPEMPGVLAHQAFGVEGLDVCYIGM